MNLADTTARRVAIAAWQNRVAPVFDVAQQVRLVDVVAGKVVAESTAALAGDLPTQRALRLAELRVGVLICGAISRPLAIVVAAQGIQLIPFVAGNLDDVVAAWLGRDLGADRFAMPGCCRSRREPGQGQRRQHRQVKEDVMGREQGGGRGGGGGGGRVGRGRMGGPRAGGPNGICVCPHCGHQEPHVQGQPCNQKTCPQCGSALQRQ